MKRRMTADQRYWILTDPVTGEETRIRRVNGGAELNTPIPPEWDEYVTQSPVKLEVIPDQLWDTRTFVDATTTNLTFFGTVNPGLSNMTQPGFLPNPQAFLIECIRVYYRVGIDVAGVSTAADVIALQNTGQLLLTIGNKQYGPWRLWTIPSNSWVQFMVAAGNDAVTSYPATRGREWALFPPLMVSPMQNFQVDLQWATAPDITTNRQIEVLFDGKRSRAVQ